ncbi:MAG: retroviral-like aspartic protease family protein [Croceibacterium sp.]
MSWYHYLAALGAVAGVTATIEPGEPIAIADADVLQMQRERYERMTVPVTIKGEGPFRFMIDTGAQATVLASSLADRLALTERGSAILVGMASRERIETAEIPEFGVGKRTFTILTAPLVERGNIGGADGILGLDSLQGQRVLLDFVNDEISVADAAEIGRANGYEIVVKARQKLGQLIITDARVNGVATAVIVDTGAQGSIGNLALLERLRGRDLGTTEMTDINGQQLSGVVRTGRVLELGEVQLNNFPIVFADSPPFHALGLGDKPALVLGMTELRNFRRVAIDFEKRRVLFDLPRGVRGPDWRRSAFGML